MLLSSLINPDCVFYDLDADTIETAIDIVVDKAVLCGLCNDAEAVKHSLKEREKQRHTCISATMAVPRGCAQGVPQAFLSIVKLKSPVICYTGQERLLWLFVLVSPVPRNIEYLKILSSIAESLRTSTNRELLKKSVSLDDMIKNLESIWSTIRYK